MISWGLPVSYRATQSNLGVDRSSTPRKPPLNSRWISPARRSKPAPSGCVNSRSLRPMMRASERTRLCSSSIPRIMVCESTTGAQEGGAVVCLCCVREPSQDLRLRPERLMTMSRMLSYSLPGAKETAGRLVNQRPAAVTTARPWSRAGRSCARLHQSGGGSPAASPRSAWTSPTSPPPLRPDTAPLTPAPRR
jgi:hypothetical protein